MENLYGITPFPSACQSLIYLKIISVCMWGWGGGGSYQLTERVEIHPVTF